MYQRYLILHLGSGLVILLNAYISMTTMGIQTPDPIEPNVSAAFEEEYSAYRDALKLDDQEHPYRSSSYGPRSCVHLQRISQLGIQVLPNLIQRMAETNDVSLNLPMHLITKKAFARREWHEGIPMDSKGELQLYLDWWKTGRKSTGRLFGERDSEWRAFREQGKQFEAQGKMEEIRSLGIAAMPFVLRKLKEGRAEFVPVISKLTDGRVDPNASPAEVVSWWESNRDHWLIPFPNGRPIAKVGPDQTVIGGDMVQLDASPSGVDPDGDELSYDWSQISGPSVELSGTASARPTFVAPVVEQQTTLIFQLIVDDAGDLSKTVPTPNSKSLPAVVRITVNPKR